MTEFSASFTGPVYVGYFVCGGNCINFTVRPNWFQRLNYRVCFGWRWYNYDA